MPTRIGVLAEAETDCLAVVEIIRRIADASNLPRPSIRTYAAKGCAMLRRKAAEQMRLMVYAGYTVSVLIHDLDLNPENNQLNDERTLRSQLEDIEVPAGMTRLVCIPVEELEAWFWADDALLKWIAGKDQRVNAPLHPHTIRKPKEKLQSLAKRGGKPIDTNTNRLLAQKLDLNACESRCPSFHQLAHFIRSVL